MCGMNKNCVIAIKDVHTGQFTLFKKNFFFCWMQMRNCRLLDVRKSSIRFIYCFFFFLCFYDKYSNLSWIITTRCALMERIIQFGQTFFFLFKMLSQIIFYWCSILKRVNNTANGKPEWFTMTMVIQLSDVPTHKSQFKNDFSLHAYNGSTYTQA